MFNWFSKTVGSEGGKRDGKSSQPRKKKEKEKANGTPRRTGKWGKNWLMKKKQIVAKVEVWGGVRTTRERGKGSKSKKEAKVRPKRELSPEKNPTKGGDKPLDSN